MRARHLFSAFGLAVALSPVGVAQAEVKPHALFSDGAVLQQGRRVPVWGTAEPEEEVRVQLRPRRATTKADEHGDWMVWLEPLNAGGPFTLTITGKNTVEVKDVLVGEVWIASGQSNMAWPLNRTHESKPAIASSSNPMLRLFTVPRRKADTPQRDVDGEWSASGPETVPSFSAVAYYFGRDLQKALNMPVGMIHTSWGGSPAEVWLSENALATYEDGKAIAARYAAAKERYDKALAAFNALSPEERKSERRPGRGWVPTELYNGMIVPLLPYGIAGAIWYQGESNAGRAYQYRSLFPAMIRNWRRDWGQGDFPFLFVQLAPYDRARPKGSWPELREAQLLTTKLLPNTGMAVITDVGEEGDIHPKKKAPVGARLALVARAISYGQAIPYSRPAYESLDVDGDKAVLRFSHGGGGMVARGLALTGFTIAGADRKFVNADAKIDGNTIVVRSPKVARPVAVRYGWADYPTGNLWNQAGLPASPFRTDNFPMKTGPK